MKKPRCTAKDIEECFNCPFPDCIAGYREIKIQDACRVEKEGKKKPEWKARSKKKEMQYANGQKTLSP